VKIGKGDYTIVKHCYAPGSSRFASTTDPNTWDSYDAALAMKGCDGPGFVLTDHENICGIDLDWSFDPVSGLLRPWASEILASADTYAEYSPTPNKGAHLWGVVADDVPTIGFTLKLGPDDQHAEIYIRGGGGRFLTVTNRPLGEARPIAEFSPLIRRLLALRGTNNQPSVNNLDGQGHSENPDAGLAWLPKRTVGLILHGAPAGADRSKELYHVVSELREIGWTTDRIVALLRAHPEGIAARCFERGRDDVERQVRLCLRRIDDFIAARRFAPAPPQSSA
jgi:hypothetical protein